MHGQHAFAILGVIFSWAATGQTQESDASSSFISSTSSLPSQYRSDSTPPFGPSSSLITPVDDDSTKPHISVSVSVVAAVMCILVVLVAGSFAFFVARRRKQKRLRRALLYPTPPSGNGRRGCQIADLANQRHPSSLSPVALSRGSKSDIFSIPVEVRDNRGFTPLKDDGSTVRTDLPPTYEDASNPRRN